MSTDSRAATTVSPGAVAAADGAELVVEPCGPHVLIRHRDEEPWERSVLTGYQVPPGDVVVLASAAAHRLHSLPELLPSVLPGVLMPTGQRNGLSGHVPRVNRIWLAVSGVGDANRNWGNWLHRMAEQFGVEILAPHGTLVLVPGGTLFVAARAGHSGWLRYRADAPGVLTTSRYPVPLWDAALPRQPLAVAGLVADPVPAGLAVREAGAPPITGDDLAFAVPVHGGQPKLILGRPGDGLMSPDAVAALVGRLHPTVRGQLLVVPVATGPSDPHWLAALADKLGQDVVASRGMQLVDHSGIQQTIVFDDHGSQLFRPFGTVVRQRPRVSAVDIVDIAPAPRGWSRCGARHYRPDAAESPARAEVTPAGLVLNLNGAPAAPAAAFDPVGWTITVGSPARPVTEPLILGLERLIAGLTGDQLRTARIKVVGSVNGVDGLRLISFAEENGVVLDLVAPAEEPEPGPDSERTVSTRLPFDQAVAPAVTLAQPPIELLDADSRTITVSAHMVADLVLPSTSDGPVADKKADRKKTDEQPAVEDDSRTVVVPADSITEMAWPTPSDDEDENPMDAGTSRIDPPPARRPARSDPPQPARPASASAGRRTAATPDTSARSLGKQSAPSQAALSQPALNQAAPSQAAPTPSAAPVSNATAPRMPSRAPLMPSRAPLSPQELANSLEDTLTGMRPITESDAPGSRPATPPPVPSPAPAPPASIPTATAPPTTPTPAATPPVAPAPMPGAVPLSSPVPTSMSAPATMSAPGPVPTSAAPVATSSNPAMAPVTVASGNRAAPAARTADPVYLSATPPPDRPSKQGEQDAFSQQAAGEFNEALAIVNAALATWPALRNISATGVDSADARAVKVDYVAVCLYLSAGGHSAARLNTVLRSGHPVAEPGYVPCLVSGLRRLPTHRRPVMRQARLEGAVQQWYPVGLVLTEPGFLSTSVATDITVAGADVDYLIWPRSARRTSALAMGQPVAEAVFFAGTRFRVLAVRTLDEDAELPDGPERPRTAVLLRELLPHEEVSVGALTDVDQETLSRLDKVLAERHTVAVRVLDDPDVVWRLAAEPIGLVEGQPGAQGGMATLAAVGSGA